MCALCSCRLFAIITTSYRRDHSDSNKVAKASVPVPAPGVSDRIEGETLVYVRTIHSCSFNHYFIQKISGIATRGERRRLKLVCLCLTLEYQVATLKENPCPQAVSVAEE